MFGVTNRQVGPRDTIMFDIDETLVTRDGRPITQMVGLLRSLKKCGYKILLMTARPASGYTPRQMRELKIPYDYLMFVPARQKTAVKNQLKLNIILSVGDLKTDLGGSPYFIKLPGSRDPMYATNISTASDYRSSCT